MVPVFPPEGSEVVRAGSLPGEPSPRVTNEEVRFFILGFERFVLTYPSPGPNSIGNRLQFMPSRTTSCTCLMGSSQYLPDSLRLAWP